jgi:hypothetical protein
MGDRRSAYRTFRTPRSRGPLRMAGMFFALLCTHAVAAAEIVRWVDANGVTQFTDPQLAAAPATVVQLQSANGMDVPSGAPTRSGRGPSFTKISKAPKKNKRGWRHDRTIRNRGRNHRRR